MPKTKTKLELLDIEDWCALLDRYQETPQYRPGAAMRIENTQFTTARYYGGMRFNGDTYTYFEPPIPGEKNEDGSQTVAWLMVREDFLRWARKEIRKK